MNNDKTNKLLALIRESANEVAIAAKNAEDYGMLNGCCVSADSKLFRLSDKLLNIMAIVELLRHEYYLPINAVTIDKRADKIAESL